MEQMCIADFQSQKLEERQKELQRCNPILIPNTKAFSPTLS